MHGEKKGEKICVIFQIKCGDINLNLPSRDCPKAGGGGGGRKKLHPKEDFIIDEWRKQGFSEKDINPGMVVSFWGFVKRKCG